LCIQNPIVSCTSSCIFIIGLQTRVFLPTPTFLPPGSGMGVYRGILLNTARIQISNQNLLLPLVQTVLNGIPRYK
jgi:hypothetical protein